MATSNVVIAGATYPDVPAVTLNKSGGGTASYVNISDTTAAASDVAQGKYFYTSSGQRVEGTASGGGALSFVDALSLDSLSLAATDGTIALSGPGITFNGASPSVSYSGDNILNIPITATGALSFLPDDTAYVCGQVLSLRRRQAHSRGDWLHN